MSHTHTHRFDFVFVTNFIVSVAAAISFRLLYDTIRTLYIVLRAHTQRDRDGIFGFGFGPAQERRNCARAAENVWESHTITCLCMVNTMNTQWKHTLSIRVLCRWFSYVFHTPLTCVRVYVFKRTAAAATATAPVNFGRNERPSPADIAISVRSWTRPSAHVFFTVFLFFFCLIQKFYLLTIITNRENIWKYIHHSVINT